MSKSLDDALGDGAWSVSAVIFDLDDMLDDEGRPISERRADALARVGVEMEMRRCPFEGIRKDKWMNVSALVQITHYLNPVLAEMAALRRQLAGEDVTWEDILAGVIDLLSGPARYLLQQRSPKGPVPAQVAVGHKLAAGFFGVMRGLNERRVLGADIPVTVDSFLNLIDEMDALLGASEACAGSPPMIRKAVTALLEGSSDIQVEIDPLRLDIARCLAIQVQLGVFWHMYDLVHEWLLIRGEFSQHLSPFNNFLERKIETTRNKLDETAPPRPVISALPEALDEQLRQSFVDALNDAADEQILEEDLRTNIEMLNEPGSAIEYNGPIEPFARSAANYLNTYRLFKDELSKIELDLREHLGFSLDKPIRLGLAVFPNPKALPWYELILGCRLGEDGHLTGRSTRVRVVTPYEEPRV